MTLVFLISALVTLTTAPVVLWFLRHRKIYDVPNHRSGHDLPTPRGGGIAALFGLVAGGICAHMIDARVPWLGLMVVIGVAMIGLVDDLRSLPALFRLLCQIVAGALLGWLVGGFDVLLLIPLGVIAMVWIVNVTNFMDGINGISAMTCILWGGVEWWTGRSLHLPMVSLMGALSIGIGIGFIPWNAPKAKMFPGDVGAYLYGAIFTLGFLLASAKGWHAAVLTVTPLSVYMADTSFTLIKRLKGGHHPFEPHREFVFHRLVSTQGWPHWVVACIVVGLSGLITAPWALLDGIWISITVTIVVCGIYVFLPEILTALRQRRKLQTP